MSNILIVTGYDCAASDLEQRTNEREHTVKSGVLEEFCRQFGGAIDWRHAPGSDTTLLKMADKSQKGWANASSYKVLDELKAASAEHRFLLLYQAPEAVFTDAYRSAEGDLSVVNDVLEKWAQANRLILNFFQNNREISALVNVSAPQDQISDFSGICCGLIGREVPITPVDVKDADSVLAAQAPQLIDKFVIYQELYGKLQLAASLPGEDLNQSGNFLMRARYLASLAAESLLMSGAAGKGSAGELEGKNQELENELELSLLQIHQLQEELEYYFSKYEGLREISERRAGVIDENSPAAICRSMDFCLARSLEIYGSYAENGYKDIHLKIEGLALADGRYLDKLSCKLAVKAGMTGLEFRANEDGMLNALSTWPEEMRDEYGAYLLFIPNAAGEELVKQQRMLASLNTEDRQFICGVANVLADHFAADCVQGTENFSLEDLRDWRLAAIELAKDTDRLNSFISVDEVLLREELISQSYNHLWIECRNLQFGKRIYPSYSFKFALVPNADKYNLLLEFRELDDKRPPLEAWPPESQDEYGHKLDVSLNVDSRAVRIDLASQVSEADRAMLSSIVKKLPILTESLATSGYTSKKGWDFWLNQVADLNQKSTNYGSEKIGLLHRAKIRLSR